ncbi:MAG: sugar nucleotide-binding protein [Candidatus Uhrbacteria bacterium]|nr:sugar nucleotide-binding protein [Candidatus Uhrbacteria bacterium]
MNILLTGGSGKLGTAIRQSGLFPNLSAPSHQELDITNEDAVMRYMETNEFEGVIHTAALVSIEKCEKNPIEGITVNLGGTSNLVRAVLRKNPNLRFIHISTDQLYGGKGGNHKETDPLIPYQKYGWTKLGAECSVNLLPNACLVRTAFFVPDYIPFDESPDDMYSSKLPVAEVAKNIFFLYSSDITGPINIGSPRMSSYERFSKYKPSLKKISFRDVKNQLDDVPIGVDTSLDSSKWNRWLAEHL